MPDVPESSADAMSREELVAEVERLRWLRDANLQVPWSADASGNITDFSQRWLDLTGLTREQALGEGWVQAPHPDDLPRMVEAWTRSIATGERYDVRHRIRVADGSHRWMRTWAMPRRSPTGVILAWLGSTEDVHEAMVQTERLYATADALPAMVFHVDTDQIYRFANKNVEATFGRPRSEILGRTIREMIGETTYAAVLPYLEKALAGERTGWAMWIEFATGRRFTRATYVPSLDSEGRVIGIDVLAADETEARLTQEALERSEAALHHANEELERRVAERTEGLSRANRDLNEFAYSVAHDLRAPLRAIVFTSSLLLEDASDRLTQEERDLLGRQAKAATKLAQIVDDLLGFARLANAKLVRRRLDVTGLAREAADEVKGRYAGSVIEIQEQMVSEGDASLVGYVLVNLLDNACKFSPGGGAVRVGQANGAFFVRDRGVGFDMAHAHKLFVAFERLVDQETFQGTGVGLANVKRIVEKHDGRVWAESALGKGATFWFTLG